MNAPLTIHIIAHLNSHSLSSLSLLSLSLLSLSLYLCLSLCLSLSSLSLCLCLSLSVDSKGKEARRTQGWLCYVPEIMKRYINQLTVAKKQCEKADPAPRGSELWAAGGRSPGWRGRSTEQRVTGRNYRHRNTISKPVWNQNYRIIFRIYCWHNENAEYVI